MKKVIVKVIASSEVELDDDYNMNNIDEYVKDNYYNLIYPPSDFKLAGYQIETEYEAMFKEDKDYKIVGIAQIEKFRDRNGHLSYRVRDVINEKVEDCCGFGFKKAKDALEHYASFNNCEERW